MGVTNKQTIKQENKVLNNNKRKKNQKPKQQNKQKGPQQKVKVSDLDKQVNAKPPVKQENKVKDVKPRIVKQENNSPTKVQPQIKTNGSPNITDKKPVNIANKDKPKKKKTRSRNKKKVNDTSLNTSGSNKDTINESVIKNKRQKKREKTKLKKQVFDDKIKKLKAGTLQPQDINVDVIKQKIEAIGEPATSTSKRRLRKLKLLLNLVEGKANNADNKQTDSKISKSGKRRERRDDKIQKVIKEQKMQNEIWENDTKIFEQRLQNIKKEEDKKPVGSLTLKKPVKDDSDYEVEHMIKADKITKKLKSEVPMDSEDEVEDSDEDKQTEEEDDDEEKADDNESEEMDQDEDESEQEASEGDSDDNEAEADSADSDNKEETLPNKQPKADQKKLNLLNKVGNKKSKENQNKVDPKKMNQLLGKNARYVVFVGNLPYSVKKEELHTHFLKAGEIKDVRIITDKGSKKPKGFAYVELLNPESYQKALSLHHTMIGGRRINVLYTLPGNKKSADAKKVVKKKNFKLGAMRKQGMLAGSVKPAQKRSARRNKAKGKNVKAD